MSAEYNKKTLGSNIVRSFDYAIKGLVYAIKTQRNMRIHMCIAILVIIVSLFLNLTRLELIVVIFAVALVLITELINTALEMMVNLITEEHHPIAKIIKDMSAGAVLFASICAAVAGYLIFIRKEVLQVFEKAIVLKKISTFPPYLAAAVGFLVLVISLFMKSVFSDDPSISGGMPSIHTAVAFSLAVMIYILTSNIYALLLSGFIAAMVAQARLSSRIHNLWEVLAGALLGIAITLFVFQVLV